MNGKRVLVTGATNGVGKISALELARMGAEVIVVSRSQQKCQATVNEIKLETGNQNVEYMVADLSSMQAIRELADEFHAKYDSLDVLLNNAGGFFNSRQESTDGYELTLALNHLNYFLLTHLLLSDLKNAAETNSEARVVNVSSGAHEGARNGINFDDTQRKESYSGFGVYSETKLMNILFTYELARRLEGTNITVNALHPGFVNTGFGMNNRGIVSFLLGIVQRVFAKSPEQGAETQIYLASSPEVKGVSGKYFDNMKAVQSSAISYNEGVQARLWELSGELVGLVAKNKVEG